MPMQNNSLPAAVHPALPTLHRATPASAAVPITPADPVPFTIGLSVTAFNCYLIPRGELDMASAQELDTALSRLLRDGHRAVTVDLSELTFIDCRGVRALAEATERFSDAGGRLVLTRPAPPVVRVLDLLQLDAELDIV